MKKNFITFLLFLCVFGLNATECNLGCGWQPPFAPKNTCRTDCGWQNPDKANCICNMQCGAYDGDCLLSCCKGKCGNNLDCYYRCISNCYIN